MSNLPNRGVNITLSALLAWLPAIPMFWYVIQPVLVNSVSAAMTGEIKIQVQEEVLPMQQAFIVLIRRDIASLRRQIAELEYQRDNQASEWRAEDAKNLVDLYLELESSQTALKALNHQ